MWTNAPAESSRKRKDRQLVDLFSLAGRVALVTGGSRGLGRMIAAGFLRQGARVYISSRKAASCAATAADLSQLGECFALPADVSTVAGARCLADELGTREAALDIAVHNAGSVRNERFAAFTEAGWDKVLDLNLKSPFFLTQCLYPLLLNGARRRYAKVIHVASIDGLSVNAYETYSYAASKAGLIHLTRRLALRLIEDGIVVSCIAPGAFPSDMNRDARDDPELAASRIPARRVGSAEDIAGAAIYLASRAGDYVVGETLVVDGGWSLTRG
ncbi:MAG: SDR family oxidoreductase [Lautropia sp.]